MAGKSKKLAMILKERERIFPNTENAAKSLNKDANTMRQRMTNRQRNFARDVCSGMNLSEAYRNHYDVSNSKPETVWHNACTLAANPKVKKRIREIYAEMDTERSNEDALLTAYVLKSLVKEADGAKNDGARIRALELIGKTVNMFIETKETDTKEDRSSETIKQDIEKRLNKLNLLRVIGSDDEISDG
jgi:hypothetical protein